jgi:hypothetical protein
LESEVVRQGEKMCRGRNSWRQWSCIVPLCASVIACCGHSKHERRFKQKGPSTDSNPNQINQRAPISKNTFEMYTEVEIQWNRWTMWANKKLHSGGNATVWCEGDIWPYFQIYLQGHKPTLEQNRDTCLWRVSSNNAVTQFILTRSCIVGRQRGTRAGHGRQFGHKGIFKLAQAAHVLVRSVTVTTRM